MKNAHWFLAVTIFLLGVSAAPLILADEVGWYVGGGSGSSDDKDLVEEENGFKVFGGYRLNKHLTLEAAVVQLGEFAAEESGRQGTAWEALGTLPIGKHFELFGKGGLFIWSVTVPEFQCRNVFGSTVCGEFDSTSDDGIDLTYGVGTHIHFTRKWSARLEWERFVDVGDSDIDLSSFGVIYKF